MLLISTNLSVPRDVDTLQITVTRNGRSEPLSQQCYWLNGFNPSTMPACRAGSLAGTVALVWSDEKSGLLKVHLELRQGGVKGPVRVQRDAELQIPSEGLKQLAMPLDFLCLEGSLSVACGTGTTCQAGSCVDDKIGQLADYVPTPAGTCAAQSPESKTAPCCFDVLGNFGLVNDSNSTFAQEDDSLGECVIKGSYSREAPNINVALIVDPTQAGSLGVCDPNTGTCLVPLDPGPEGWRALRNSKDEIVAIALPHAVCANRLGVAIKRASTQFKDNSVDQCLADPICVGVGGICPGDWSGFSCPAGTPPPQQAQDVCGQVQTDATAGPVVPGLWCCYPSDQPQGNPAQRDPLLIDDMSSGPLIKLKPEADNASGGWYSFCDDGNAVISPPPAPALFTFRKIDPAVTPATGAAPISHAACLRSDGFSGYVALEGFNFQHSPPNYLQVPFDVSPYTGIRFWASSVPAAQGKLNVPALIRVEMPDLNTSTQISDSTCMTQGGRDKCDSFGKSVSLPEDGSWALYTIKWAELEQQGYGLPFTFNSQVYSLNFDVLGPGPQSRSFAFDFCVAQLEFTRD